MNTLLIISAIFAFASIQFVCAKSVGNRGPSFEIRDGNCSGAVMGDLVFQDHVHKLAIPFVKRDDTSHWEGTQNIYCVLALSQDGAAKTSTVEITKGGLYSNSVTLEFHSARGDGFEYDIKVFGKF